MHARARTEAGRKLGGEHARVRTEARWKLGGEPARCSHMSTNAYARGTQVGVPVLGVLVPLRLPGGLPNSVCSWQPEG